jgi:hypothetical protein
MPAQLITVIAPARRRAPRSIAPAYHDNPSIRTATPALEPTVASMMDQLAQTLTILRDTVEQVLEGTSTSSTMQALQHSLTPTARQAEAAVQRLRGLSLATTARGIDLSQALTVLVLASDMLAQDRRTAPMNLALYELLRRNAERALLSLDILSSELVIAS